MLSKIPDTVLEFKLTDFLTTKNIPEIKMSASWNTAKENFSV